MKLVNDLSNYDADHDASNPNWAAEFIAAGCEGIIVGSQWPEKARRQLIEAKAAGLPILGTYAEPNSMTAVSLAQEFGARYVGLACEPGSITSYPELAQCVARVRGAGLIPLIYGNQGDLTTIARGKFGDELLWLASYGTDDPANPRPPITDVDFGGWTKVAVHQYSSTIVIAGRVRDHNYWMVPEEGLSVEDKARLGRLERIVAGWGFDDDDGKRLTGEDAVKYIDDKQRSMYLGLQITENELAAHEAKSAEQGHGQLV